MQHTHERRVSGVRRVPVERIVDVCGASDPASAFQGRSVDVSGRGMQVRAAHLPELRAPIVVRFQEQGSDVIAEGEVAWRRACASGGEFGVRFTALDSRSVQVLKALCGVAGFEDLEPSPVEPSRSWQPDVSRAETDHDTDPAPPAALGVRLHIAGLTSPLHAQIKGQGSRSLEVGSQLEFLRVGRSLEIEDLAYGSRRPAVVESVDVSVDQKSRVPELLVSVRYSEGPDLARSALRARTPEPQRARAAEPQRVPMPESRARTPEPGSARTAVQQATRAGELQRARPVAASGVSDRDSASQALPPTAPRTPSPASPPAGARSPSDRGRPAPLGELDLSTTRELGDDESEDDERDSTPPPLPMRADRAEPPSSKSLREAAPKRQEREPEDNPEGAVADSAEALLERLEGMLGGASLAARAAGAEVARWGGKASRGAGWLLGRARRAMQAPRRPAVPRRRTAAPPRSSLRSSPLRQNPQLNVQRPRSEEASVAPRAQGSRALLWSCLVAVVAVSIGYFARRGPILPAAPAAARVVAAALPAPAVLAEPSPRVSAVAPSAPAEVVVGPSSGVASRTLSSSVSADEDSNPLESTVAASAARLAAEGLNGSTRGLGSSSGGDEFGQGRLQKPVIYRLRLDDVGGTLRGERTATGFEISIQGRRVLDSGTSITRRDPRVAKVSTHNSSQGTRISFRFRETIPAYKVRLKKDVLEISISES